METELFRDFFAHYKGQRLVDAFRIEMEGKTAVVTFDTPQEKVNKWSTPAMVAFYDLMDQLESKGVEAAVFLSNKPGIFIAGADINEILHMRDETHSYQLSRLGQQLFDRWERLPFPTVAAIHGAAMGGGCEFLLACTARIASDDPSTKIALPEVQLGIFPGWGGTQRLPHMIGLPGALDMILSGRALSGREAARRKLVTAAVPKEILRQQALLLARSLVGNRRWNKFAPKLSTSEAFLSSFPGRVIALRAARKQLMARTLGNYPGHLGALKVVEQTFGGSAPRAKGYEIEAQEFARVAVMPEAKNLVRLFFMMEAAKKTSYPVQQPVAPQKVSSLAVVGAGVMGAGMAAVGIRKNMMVYFKDISEAALGKGLSHISKDLSKEVKRKKVTREERERIWSFMHPIVDLPPLKKAQLVIEAIVEDLKVKQKLFSEIEKTVSPQTVLATNTSTLSVASIAEGCQHPERVIGIHFFNPVEKMPLVEVVVGPKSDAKAVATGIDFVKRLGKTPLVCKDSPGFVVNRLLLPYLNEAGHLLMTGVSVEAVDRCFKQFGMPMGPYRLMDEVGFDICQKASGILHTAFGDRMRPPACFDKFLAVKLLGRKGGVGFYRYDGNEEKINPDIPRVLGLSSPSSNTADEKWTKRLLYLMINEAARVLDEGVVESAEFIDLGMILGTGFAPFRGGLLRWADTLDLSKVVADLEEMGSLYAAKERFEPCARLGAMARSGKKFYESV